MKRNRYRIDFARYVIPNVFGMLGLSCYILADTYFISKGMGAKGLTALNLALPVYSFIHGSGLMIGMGGGTKFSIARVQGDTATSNQVFTNAMMLAAVFAMLFFAGGIGFSGQITSLLGADEVVFGMTQTYLRVILMFSPVFILNNILLCFVRNDGAPQLAMAAMLGGSISNIILDYIFIFPLDMGIFGAVLATGFAPVISIMILSPFFLKKRNSFRLVACAPMKNLLSFIVSSGLPSLITELSSGIVIIVFNMIILRLAGNTGVAAYGVVANLSLVLIAIYTGIAQGVQPLISCNYGAGNLNGIRAVFRYALVTVVAISLVVYACVFFRADQIAGIFNGERNEQLQQIAVVGLKCYFIGGLMAGINIVMSVYFTSIEYASSAHIISLLRGFVVIIPAAFLLSMLGGITGVWLAFPVTELLVCLVALMLWMRQRKKFSC